jgi:Fe-S oxidoreductase
MATSARLPSPSSVDRPQTFPAEGERRMRVALLTGCAQTVLDPAINEATVRLLKRLGAEVVGSAFLVELDFLNGRAQLGDIPVHSVIHIE